MASASRSNPPNLAEYVFTERLGSGTYATVYKAYRKGGHRDVVAVKCIQKSSLNKVSTENLLTEIELLKTLKHENIVWLKDFQWDDSYIYLIMEYCHGGDLSKFIRQRRALAEISVKRFLQQLAAALQYMRSMNVSHMDLKPPNILMSSAQQPTLKIGDFGFAHYLVGDVDAVHLRGSPLYMAPEIITQRFYNEKADLWSLGVILYECLFGRAPFASKSIKELESRIIDPKPIELPYGVEVSDSCRHLLMNLLKRDPHERMSFEEFFNHPFVDLEHKPCDESLQKAIELVTEAVEKDSSGNIQQAIDLYCKALEYFMPAIFYENDARKKCALRHKVKEYMNRAEELKNLMKPQLTVQKSVSLDPKEELEFLCSSHSCLKQALTTAKQAQHCEHKEDYVGALEHYETALESLITALPEEPGGRRRDLLQSQVSLWLSKAEAIKNYMRVKDLHTVDTSHQESVVGTESQPDNGSCLVQ